jgi:uncharacterized membrane protein
MITVMDLLKDRELAIHFYKDTRSKITTIKTVSNVIFDVLVLVLFVPAIPDKINFIFLITVVCMIPILLFLNVYDFRLRWKSFKKRY